MCIMIREAMYDEDKSIAIIDSDSLFSIKCKVLELSVKYQDEIENFMSLEHPKEKDIDKLNEVTLELSTYRKALQVKSSFKG